MLIYLLKSGLCLAVLFAFYKIFMEAENMHKLKRFYLIGAILFSLLLPLISISYTVEVSKEALESNLITDYNSTLQPASDYQTVSYLTYGLIAVYITGFLFFGFRFTKNLMSIFSDIRNHENRRDWKYIFVLLKENLVPHTFLNYIFLNKTEYEQERISDSVLEHEKAHVDQKHSLDIIFIEFLQVIFWFNPLFYFWKGSIKLNHEFLADEQVLTASNDALEYSHLLLSYNHTDHQRAFSSQINSSLIKKRIIMISKDFSVRRMLTKLGLLLPVLALCVYLFNNEIVAKPVFKTSDLNSTEFLNTVQGPGKLSIKLEGDAVFMNGKKVKLKDLSEELDRFAKGRADKELKKMDFNVQVSQTDKKFIDKVNAEFKKSRISKVTGFSLIPPPPPAPSEAVPAPPAPPAPKTMNVEPPAPPAVPEPKVHEKTPPAPPAQPYPEHDSIKRLARMEMMQERIHERMDRKRAKMEKIRAEHMELRREKMDSLRAQREVIHEEKMAERMAMIEQRHVEMKEKHAERRAHMEAERDRMRAEMKKRMEEEKKKSENEKNGS